jgi:hypothetical protein
MHRLCRRRRSASCASCAGCAGEDAVPAKTLCHNVQNCICVCVCILQNYPQADASPALSKGFATEGSTTIQDTLCRTASVCVCVCVCQCEADAPAMPAKTLCQLCKLCRLCRRRRCAGEDAVPQCAELHMCVCILQNYPQADASPALSKGPAAKHTCNAEAKLCMCAVHTSN